MDSIRFPPLFHARGSEILVALGSSEFFLQNNNCQASTYMVWGPDMCILKVSQKIMEGGEVSYGLHF